MSGCGGLKSRAREIFWLSCQEKVKLDFPKIDESLFSFSQQVSDKLLFNYSKLIKLTIFTCLFYYTIYILFMTKCLLI